MRRIATSAAGRVVFVGDGGAAGLVGDADQAAQFVIGEHRLAALAAPVPQRAPARARAASQRGAGRRGDAGRVCRKRVMGRSSRWTLQRMAAGPSRESGREARRNGSDGRAVGCPHRLAGRRGMSKMLWPRGSRVHRTSLQVGDECEPHPCRGVACRGGEGAHLERAGPGDAAQPSARICRIACSKASGGWPPLTR